MKNYKVVLDMMDLPQVSEAVEHFYVACRPIKFNNTTSYEQAHTECMNGLILAMKESVQ